MKNEANIFSTIMIDDNPMNSKALKEAEPHKVIQMCLQEIIKGLKLNSTDLVFYVLALEHLAMSLKSEMQRRDTTGLNMKIYRRINELTTVHTISGERSEKT